MTVSAARGLESAPIVGIAVGILALVEGLLLSGSCGMCIKSGRGFLAPRKTHGTFLNTWAESCREAF